MLAMKNLRWCIRKWMHRKASWIAHHYDSCVMIRMKDTRDSTELTRARAACLIMPQKGRYAGGQGGSSAAAADLPLAPWSPATDGGACPTAHLPLEAVGWPCSWLALAAAFPEKNEVKPRSDHMQPQLLCVQDCTHHGLHGLSSHHGLIAPSHHASTLQDIKMTIFKSSQWLSSVREGNFILKPHGSNSWEWSEVFFPQHEKRTWWPKIGSVHFETSCFKGSIKEAINQTEEFARHKPQILIYKSSPE